MATFDAPRRNTYTTAYVWACLQACGGGAARDDTPEYKPVTADRITLRAWAAARDAATVRRGSAGGIAAGVGCGALRRGGGRGGGGRGRCGGGFADVGGGAYLIVRAGAAVQRGEGEAGSIGDTATLGTRCFTCGRRAAGPSRPLARRVAVDAQPIMAVCSATTLIGPTRLAVRLAGAGSSRAWRDDEERATEREEEQRRGDSLCENLQSRDLRFLLSPGGEGRLLLSSLSRQRLATS